MVKQRELPDMSNPNNNGESFPQKVCRLIILTEGHSEPVAAKTATSVLRYRPKQVVALLDSTQAGKTTQQVLGVGGEIPIIANVDAAPEANTLMLGIAPSGGHMPRSWRPIVLAAIDRGMDVISGLHEFLNNDSEFSQAAAAKGVKLIDVRKNNERDVSTRLGIREECLRIHTVGHDCSVGKMLVAIELSQAMRRQGVDSKFIATGQTGILVEGDGCPVDCVVSDFVSGAVEKLILANQHHDILFIEGQGSLAHPRYSGVTLGLLHGCLPHGMVMCYEAGRSRVHGMEHIPLKSLTELCDVYEQMANLMSPSKVIGVAMNSRKLTEEAAERERERVRRELGLPVCDVIRHGPDELVQAILQMAPLMVAS
jgi:uncharacterized NAD-dependent epimerase/dehydratase family protein